MSKYIKAHLMTGFSKSRNKFDHYKTPYKVIYALLKREAFDKNDSFLDPCTGTGRFPKVMKKFFGEDIDIFSSDLYDYGYGDEIGIDFAKNYHTKFKKEEWFSEKSFGNILTNPPFDEKILPDIIKNCKKVARNKICLILKLNHLCGVKRYLANMYLDKEFPCSKIYYFVQRLNFGVINRKTGKKSSPTLEYCAVIFDSKHKGLPLCDWIYIPNKKKKKIN
jgi:hypothetical protein